MGDRPAVLFVTAEPDDRTSTSSLRAIVDELDRRPGIDVEVWFLRAGGRPPWQPGARVVDELRTWWPSAAAERLGLGVLAGWIRGARLRSWFRATSPAVVVLDDGLGGRLLSAAPGRPVVVVRANPELPLGAALEPQPMRAEGLLLSAGGTAAGPTVLPTPDLLDAVAIGERAATSQATRAARFGIEASTPLVVGWGSDGWVDGADLFVRALWHLEDRHGITAHGLWLGFSQEPHEVERLRAEAARCGLADRFHLAPDEDEADRWCGDAVLLPYRSPADPLEVLAACAGGQAVVTFGDETSDVPWIRPVALLDLDAVAGELATALTSGSARWRTELLDQHDVGRWADRFLEAVGLPSDQERTP